jgi:hypothetical protein
VATQSDPRHSGGVVDLGAQYLGGGALEPTTALGSRTRRWSPRIN